MRTIRYGPLILLLMVAHAGHGQIKKDSLSHPVRTAASVAGSDIVIRPGTDVVLNAAVTVTAGGDFLNEGRFHGGAQSVVGFSGTGHQVILGSTSFAGLRKSGPDTLALASPIVVNGALDILEGVISTGSDSIMFGPNATFDGRNVPGQVIGPFIMLSAGYTSCSLALNSSWNLLSVPVIVPHPRVSEVFQNAVSPAYTYQSHYVRSESVKVGTGFWIKYGSSGNIELSGGTVLHDTVPVQQGWNIIGPGSMPVAVNGIGSNPPGIATSRFFGYDGNAYGIADTLRPGLGYWVKVSSNGMLLLSPPGQISASQRIRLIRDNETPPPAPGSNALARDLPTEFGLSQNYPNPFNPLTVIPFQLPVKSVVRLTIVNILGQTVKVLADGPLEAGYRSVTWDAGSEPSGIYFCRMQADSYMETRKLLLIK